MVFLVAAGLEGQRVFVSGDGLYWSAVQIWNTGLLIPFLGLFFMGFDPVPLPLP